MYIAIWPRFGTQYANKLNFYQDRLIYVIESINKHFYLEKYYETWKGKPNKIITSDEYKLLFE